VALVEAERDALGQILEGKRAELEGWRSFAKARGMSAEEIASVFDDDDKSEVPTSESEKLTSKGAKVERLRAETVSILRQQGHPMEIQAIFSALVRREVEITGAGTIQNVTGLLHSDDRFENVGYGRWGLIEWRQIGGKS
jgi:hypothetical protein